MHYFIFVPGTCTANKKQLSDVGLSDHCSGAFLTPCHEGPQGHSGVLAFWGQVESVGYSTVTHDWIPAVPQGDLAAERYWVGIDKTNPPVPPQLEYKHEALEGSLLELGDGHWWRLAQAALLPRDYVRHRDGHIVEDVFEQYRDFWNKSIKWFDALLEWDLSGETKPAIDPGEAIDYLTQALKLNYRITPEVVSHLRLFNSRNLATALVASVHGFEIRAEIDREKKDSPQAVEA